MFSFSIYFYSIMTFLQLPTTDFSIGGGGAINSPEVAAGIDVKSPKGDREITTEDKDIDAHRKSFDFGMKV